MSTDKKGRFIVFEGIDGSGKSTQLRMLADRLNEKGIEAYSTFEPSDGPIGRLIRRMLSGEVPADQRTIASLFAADRVDHLVNETNGIFKKLDKGEIVLCDRYYFSSYAYQSQFIEMDWVIHANALNAQMLRPDIVLFIDADPDTCFERIKKRGGPLEMYEKIDMMKQVRKNYFKAFEKLKNEEAVSVIDGNQTADSVARSVWQQVKRFGQDGFPHWDNIVKN